jgi:hypothetical protein
MSLPLLLIFLLFLFFLQIFSLFLLFFVSLVIFLRCSLFPYLFMSLLFHLLSTFCPITQFFLTARFLSLFFSVSLHTLGTHAHAHAHTCTIRCFQSPVPISQHNLPQTHNSCITAACLRTVPLCLSPPPSPSLIHLNLFPC